MAGLDETDLTVAERCCALSCENLWLVGYAITPPVGAVRTVDWVRSWQ